jgi:hypothetical protein
MKTKAKFLVGDITKTFWPDAKQRESARWPDIVDDHYQIRLPHLSAEAFPRAVPHPESIVEGCSAQA